MTDETENSSETQTETQEVKKSKREVNEEYVSKLRSENTSLRVKVSEIEKLKNEELLQKDKQHEEIFNQRMSEVKTNYQKEIARSKLEAFAIREGIIDSD